jgi:hypothetical protein
LLGEDGQGKKDKYNRQADSHGKSAVL